MKTIDLDTVRVFFRSAPFMVDLGVEPILAEAGRVHTELLLSPRHHQHTGQAHAGVTAAIADHTMGAAAQTLAAPGFWVLTAEFKTSLLRAATGQRLTCEAHVVKAGRQVSFAEAEVYSETDGQRTLVAKASATLAVVAQR